MSKPVESRSLSLDLIDEYERLAADPRCDIRTAYDMLLACLNSGLDTLQLDLGRRIGLVRAALLDCSRDTVAGEAKVASEALTFINAESREIERQCDRAASVIKQISGSRDYRQKRLLLRQARSMAEDMQAVVNRTERQQSALRDSICRLEAKIPELRLVSAAVRRLERRRVRVMCLSLWYDLRFAIVRASPLLLAFSSTLLLDRLAIIGGLIGQNLPKSQVHTTLLLALFALQVALLEPLMRGLFRRLLTRSLAELISRSRDHIVEAVEIQQTMSATEARVAELAGTP